MQKLLLGTLLAGLVVGCAMEDQESSGVLVDSSQEVEVPDWVTAAYLDLNKDGTVDILDLVIHSKFFGQDVVEPTVASDGSDPCQDIKAKRYDNLQIVDGDNNDMTETFSAPDGNYVYALLVLAIPRRLGGHSCFAFRFLIDNNLQPTAVVIKSVSGGDKFSASLSSENTNKHTWEAGNTYYNGSPRTSRNYSNHYSRRDQDKTVDIKVDFDFILDFDVTSYPENVHSHLRKWKNNERQKYFAERLTKSGIPVGGDKVISSISYSSRVWAIDETHKEDRCSINELLQDFEHYYHDTGCRDFGVYLKMLPAEVQQRYFPEDM